MSTWTERLSQAEAQFKDHAMKGGEVARARAQVIRDIVDAGTPVSQVANFLQISRTRVYQILEEAAAK